MASLVSVDLLKYWQRMIPPPAQLCLIRLIGTDNQFILRVRYKDVYLDKQLDTWQMPSIEEIGQILAAMGQLVVKPGDQLDGWNPSPEPAILFPINGKWHYEEHYGS